MVGKNLHLPDFVVIGAMKSGTTSLYRWLAELPEFCLSGPKEPHFFSDERKWARGVGWYASLFADTEDGRLTGEASTNYTDPRWANLVAERMAQILPNARLIYVLRHPEDRLRSHYRHEVQRGRERRQLTEATLDPSNPYVGRSLYFTCLLPFARFFPRDQILVVRFEDLISNESDAWSALLGHLGVPDHPRPDVPSQSTWTKARYTRPMLFFFERGLTRYAAKAPTLVRRVGRSILLRSGAAFERQLEQSTAALPVGVTQAIWCDVERLEKWLGNGAPLWQRQ